MALIFLAFYPTADGAFLTEIKARNASAPLPGVGSPLDEEAEPHAA